MSIRALRRAVEGEAVGAPVIAPKSFADDFELVAAHYGLRELGEYEAAKSAARANLEEAIAMFAELANEIREGNV